MLRDIVFLLISLGLILLGSELFTNGIEWFGHRLRLAEGAVGSVLAAVGTALPETMIPIIAILFTKGKASQDIGTGAILGAPLMLSTLAFFITGLAVFIFAATGRRSRKMTVDYEVLGRDLKSFFIVYAVAIAAAFLPWRSIKMVVAVFLIGAYVFYVRQVFRAEPIPGQAREPEPLHFHRVAESPHLRLIISQVLAALILIVGGAYFFVENLKDVALATGVSAFVLATIITPIATELPEKFNSVTWVRRKKDTLALGNISGAMVFQSSVLPAIGIMFTPWILNRNGLAAAIMALVSTLFVWLTIMFRKRLSPYALLAGIIFYAAYIAYVFTHTKHALGNG